MKTIKEIADALREMYPFCAAVTLFVNDHEEELTLKYVDPKKGGYSMKSINGEWIKTTVEK